MVNLRDKQSDFSRRLRQKLGGDFVVVAAPDHPFVMRSVDVLVGGRSGLTAFVMASAEERSRPELLASRVTLNKVALPPETLFVFVHDSGDPNFTKGARFVETLSTGERSFLKDAVTMVERSTKSQQKHDSEKLRQMSQARFASTYRVARLVNARRSWLDVDQALPRRGANLSFDTVQSVPSAFASRPISTRSLIGLTVRGADRWYEETGDQPIPTGATAGLVLAPGYPRPKNDPDKALRAAAFSGWVIAPDSSSGRSVEELADLALRFTSVR
jgi:hypothetical protein